MFMKNPGMKIKALLSVISTAVMLTVNSVNAMAVDTVTLPLEVYGKDVVSLALPTISEEGESPFDFIIDPQNLIYETDAARYGGGKVEEGATLLFRNHEGEYDFSRRSDRLTVKNQSNVPVEVTISACVENRGEIDIVGNTDFGDSDSCSMYLAIVDDEGNEKPISEDGEISVSTEMHRAPDDAYVYRIDEESGSYSYEFSRSPDEIDFDSYSFGLIGYCNPNGNWQDISVHPVVRVTWKVEPVLSEEEQEEEEEQEQEQEQEQPEEEAATEGDSESEEEAAATESSESAATETSVVEKREVLQIQADVEPGDSNANIEASVESAEEVIVEMHDAELPETDEEEDVSESMRSPADGDGNTDSAGAGADNEGEGGN
jgi:hypothetical protein